jgi:hypothetical protein
MRKDLLKTAQFSEEKDLLNHSYKPLPYYVWMMLVGSCLLLLFSAHLFAQTTASKQNKSLDTTEAVDFDALLAMQDAGKPLYVRYGVYGHYGVATWTRAQFVAQQSCCNDNFGDSLSLFGVNARIGALFEYPLFWRVGVSLRAEYTLSTYALRRTQQTTTGIGGVPIGTPIEYHFDISRSALAAMPLLTIRPIDFLSINFGAMFSMPLQTSYSTGEFLNVDTLTFRRATGERVSVWNESSGALSGVNPLHIGFVGGISYEAPLNAGGTWLLCPELWYERSFTSLLGGFRSRSEGISTDNGTFGADVLRIGLAVKHSPFRTIRPEISPEMQDKIRLLRRADSLNALERERNKLQLARMDSVNKVILAKLEEMKKQGMSVNLQRVVGISDDDRELTKPTIFVEEYRTNHAVMLLPAVFFEQNSSVIPSRYKKIQSTARESYRLSNLADQTPREIYYEVLNVIGKRMQEPENAGAVLFLTASGTSAETPKTVEQRAQAISDYLQDIWKIPTKRIIAQVQQGIGNTSSISSPMKRPMLFKNQSVVEISASLPSICAPLVFDKRTRRATPQRLRFAPEVNAGAGLKQWSLEVTQFAGDEVTTLKEEKGTKPPPSTIDWDFGANEEEIPRSGQDLTVQLSMTDINNRTADAPLVAVPVVQSSIEQQELSGKGTKRLLRFDVLGFDESGNPSETTQEGLQTLRTSILPLLGQSSRKRTIYFAQESSRRSAEAVASSLGLNDAVFVVKPNLLREKQSAPLGENKQYQGLVRVEVE